MQMTKSLPIARSSAPHLRNRPPNQLIPPSQYRAMQQAAAANEAANEFTNSTATNSNSPCTAATSTNKKKKKKKKTKAKANDAEYPETSNGACVDDTRTSSVTRSDKMDPFWSSMSNREERQKIREFWLQLGEDERRSLVKVEKEAVLRKMKEQQKHSCNCSVCGKKRTAIEDELEVLYDAYYEELEQYANHQRQTRIYGSSTLHDGYAPSDETYDNDFEDADHLDEDEDEDDEDDDDLDYDDVYHGAEEGDDGENDEEEEDEEEDEEEEEEDDDDDVLSHDSDPSEGSSDNEPMRYIGDPNLGPHLIKHTSAMSRNLDYFDFGDSLTVKGGILTVADDLLKNDGKKFLDMMERLAERRMQKEEEVGMKQNEDYYGDDDEEDGAYDEEDDGDTRTQEQRMEEGRRMFQIFAARMFEQRVLSAYREKVARERQQRLIQELEEEDRLRQEREQKKAQDRERKKEQKRQQKLLREAERAAKEAQRKAEEAAAKAELERKQELERQKREQERIRKEEERQKKEEERRRRIKEEKDRAAEKERRRKEKEEAERQERQKREAQERRERQQKEEEERRQREFKELKERRETELKEEMARREMEANERKRQWEKEAQEKPRSSGATEKVSRGGRSSRQTTASASNPVTDTVVPPTTRTSTAAAAATSVTVTSSSSSSSISTSSPISSSSSPLPPTGGSIVNASSIPLSSPSQSTTLASFNSTVTSHPFDQESRQKMLMDALVGSSRPTASPSLFQEPSLMDPPDIPSLRTHRPSQPLLSPNHPRSSLDLLQAMPPPPLLNGPLDLAMSVHDTPSSPTGGVALAPPSLGIGMLPMYNRASNPVENSGLSRSIGRPANHLAPIGQPVNGRRASTAAGPIGSPVVSRSGKSSIDKGSTEATPIKRPTGSVEHESTNSFFSNFLFGEPNRGSYMIPLMHHESEARTGHNVDLQPPPFNRRFSSDPVGMNWTNGWTATSMLSDNVHGKLFGDVLPDRTTMILERAKAAYQKLDEITQSKYFTSPLQFHTLIQLHRIMSDLYNDYPVDIRELYEVLMASPLNGFQCMNHAHHGIIVRYETVDDPLRRASLNNMVHSLSPPSFAPRSLPNHVFQPLPHGNGMSGPNPSTSSALFGSMT